VRRIVVVLLGALAAGCGSKESAPPTATNVETRAAAPSTPDGFTVRAERWTTAETAQIAALRPTRLTKGAVRLPAGKAYRLAYHARLRIRGALRDLAIHQYMVKRGSSLYVVTFTTEAAAEDRLRKTFRQAAHTFTITA
jgi:hypothetical protein